MTMLSVSIDRCLYAKDIKIFPTSVMCNLSWTTYNMYTIKSINPVLAKLSIQTQLFDKT